VHHRIIDPWAEGNTVSELHTTTIAGNRLTYWRSGPRTGRPLVLLHGLGSDHTGLFDLAAGLPGLDLVVPDLPGFGRSDPLSGPHTLRAYAAVLDALRVELGLARFALLGHSLGAAVALAYASGYRTPVESLVLLNPPVGVDNRGTRLSHLYGELTVRVPDPLSRLLLLSPAAIYVSDHLLFTTRDRGVRRRILREDYRTARLADARAVRECYLSLRHTPFARYVRRIRARTLLVTGTRDMLATPESLARLPWRTPYPHLEVVPGAGHLLPIESPATAAAIVYHFVAGPRRLRTLAAA
jgi:pimeloyl-ACP methyl ester carboxylesterase